MKSNISNNNCFDFIRLFAAFTVMVGHAVEHLKQNFLWFYPGSAVWFFDGVPLFFIMSGLLVYTSYQKCVERNNPSTYYYINRFLRIAPAIYFYAFATIVFLLSFSAIQLSIFKNMTFWAWLSSNIFLVPVYHPDIFKHIGVGVLNGSLWTIPAEFSFYIIVPLIFLVEKRYGFLKMIIALSIVSAMGSFLFYYGRGDTSLIFKFYKVSFLPYLIYFSLGIFWARKWESAPKNGWIALLSVSFYIVISMDLLNIGISRSDSPLNVFITGIPLSYAAVWLGYRNPFNLSKITKIGDLSYGIYIWHMVVVNSFIYFGFLSRMSASGTKAILSVIVTTAALSAVSWWFIEKPSLRFKPYSSRTPSNKTSTNNLTCLLQTKKPTIQ